jgi:hypothetical protein
MVLAAAVGQVGVANALPNNGSGWDKEGFLNCLHMQPPDSNPHDWAVVCCINSGGQPSDDGVCHPPDSHPPRPELTQSLQPATITPRQSASLQALAP